MRARGDRQRGESQTYLVLCRSLVAWRYLTPALRTNRNELDGCSALSTAHWLTRTKGIRCRNAYQLLLAS
jgi:hypothetical protein